MKLNLENYRTPGQLISALINERGWNGRVLSGILQIDESGVNRLIQDKKPVNAELALVLEDIFSVPAEDFLKLQIDFDLAKARIRALPDPSREARAKLFGNLPIAEMINRGWLNVENKKDFPKIESELLKFFNVENLDEITYVAHSAKKSNASEIASETQLAWVNRVKSIASELLVPQFSIQKAKNAEEQLKLLLFSVDEIRKVPRILAEAGIRFVIVEALKSSKMDGVCLWLNENSPVIGMSLRFDRIDNFWFVLRHELEHVIQGHGKLVPKIDIDIDLESVDEEESIANNASLNFSIPRKKMDSFIARKAPFFSDLDIRGFANTLKVHPGLIAGQLQHHTKKYNLFRKHLLPIREIIIPNAAVDGWGDVYPLD
ncbi:hypothetical protein [Acinetobacter courvalinii]|uniref:Transcriptional regulator n=1 Tax=Acinetobacter courvalinii TaxID=280147 RepID=N9PVT6_9GAMM|nr:hypothetical protein [Acinetobacter courvalinii]ENX37598.1 hypothetical protein F888_02939 [Acinetobacter courvalinii]KAB0658938.1 XRE family transcriptional regulator [Acinetobacter courvalinii]GGH26363.1 transcriptional regulator [Acinetobacter courvalinii]